MKKNSFLWAALSMTAALVMTACTNDDNMVETPAAPQAEVKTIPYSVTVSGGDAATTRATVADDPLDATNYHKTLYFATGDQLYISSDSRTDLKGTLTLKAGDEGKSSGATFEGSITYTGDAPEGTTEIKATLVGSSNVGVQITDGKVTGVSYPLDAYCGDVAEAVQKYSNLTGTSTYGSKSFTLTQQTAFLNFEITFEDGTATNTPLTAVVSNGGSPYATLNVTTTTVSEKVVAKFVLPVASGTVLSSATVKMGDKAALTINNATLTGKVYNVKKTQAAATTPLDNTTTAWTAGSYAVPAGGLTYSDAVTVNGDVTLTLTDGQTLTLNKGISLAAGATLTIEGNGAMVVNGTNNSTASTVAGSTGTLILTSGTLTATGGNGGSVADQAADFHGGNGGDAINGSVIVSGGTLTATGGNGGRAGYAVDSHGGNGGDAINGSVTVSGGTLTASGGNGGSVADYAYNCSGGNGGDAINGTLTKNGGSTSVNDGSNGSIGPDCDSCTAGTGGKGHN